MPKNIIVKKQNMRLIRAVLIALAIIAPTLGILDFGVIFAESRYQKTIEAQKAEIEMLTSKDNNKDVIGIVKKKVEFRENILKKIDSNRMQTTMLIDKLNSMMPKDVSLIRLSVENGGKVNLEGVADSETSILDFFHSLKVSGIGDNIVFNKVSNSTGGGKAGVNFTFTFNLVTRK